MEKARAVEHISRLRVEVVNLESQLRDYEREKVELKGNPTAEFIVLIVCALLSFTGIGLLIVVPIGFLILHSQSTRNKRMEEVKKEINRIERLVTAKRARLADLEARLILL